ncbi:MAG: tetrahydrodipicolinate N-succinyltransferase N-terminal domain-containing protein [Acidimicrobiales bacterium]
MTASRVIGSVDDFKAMVAEVEGRSGYRTPAAYGFGIATVSDSADGPKTLDTDFLVTNLGENAGTAAAVADALGGFATGTIELDAAALTAIVERFAPFVDDGRDHPNLTALQALLAWAQVDQPAPVPGHRRIAVAVAVTELTDAPMSASDVYLRLTLLSQCKVRPHGISLDGAFGKLNNAVWSNHGPIDPDQFDAVKTHLRLAGQHLHVYNVDKFPRMLDYVVPQGVRIGDGSRVRLGAHLGAGTTVMHEGFVNFNAGTVGPNMVEGRISAGVMVAADSDLGGGCSTMGTLSGGGTTIISVGERCLIGANAGIGISLGDDCTVEAGLYVTGGTPVLVCGLKGYDDGATIKARELSGADGLLLRRNGRTGTVEVHPNGAKWSGLNEALHQN